MADRAQLLNDNEEAQRLILDGRQSSMWTAMPGIIESVDLEAMTCEVQPAIQGMVENEDGSITRVDLPLLGDVPLVFPSGGGFALTFPVVEGDEVLVVWSSRCIDAWWQNGGVQPPMESRMHDLSDGFAIPGIKSSPNVLDDIDAARTQLRNNAGTVYLSLGSKFAMVNPTTDLKTVLTDLTSAINTFMQTLAALTPPTGPVLNSVLQVPALSAVTALASVTTKINALLEST